MGRISVCRCALVLVGTMAAVVVMGCGTMYRGGAMATISSGSAPAVMAEATAAAGTGFEEFFVGPALTVGAGVGMDEEVSPVYEILGGVDGMLLLLAGEGGIDMGLELGYGDLATGPGGMGRATLGYLIELGQEHGDASFVGIHASVTGMFGERVEDFWYAGLMVSYGVVSTPQLLDKSTWGIDE